MPGSLSRLRERVGVRVWACRHDLVSHEARRTQRVAEGRREYKFIFESLRVYSPPLAAFF